MSLNQYSQSLLSYRIWTNTYGLARTVLALGLLITLLFNSTDALFRPGLLDSLATAKASITRYSIFNLISLEAARWISIGVLLLVISGFYPRITGVLHWWVSFSFNVTAMVVDGGDQITSILTLLLIPITLADKRRNHWQSDQDFSQNPFLRMNAVLGYFFIRLQMAVLYFHAGIGKLEVTEWVDGTALYYWFTDPQIGMPEWLNSFMYYPLTNAYFITFLTWGIMIFEIALAAALVMPSKYWKNLLYFGIAFHFMIVIFHGLVSFFFAMLGGLILYLAPLHLPVRVPQRLSLGVGYLRRRRAALQVSDT